MKFLVIGLGSAGQRHVRVIRKKFPKSIIKAYVGDHRTGLISEDLQSIDNSASPFKYYELEELKSLENLTESFDLVVIATPISTHDFYFRKVLTNARRILIEKPIESDYEKSLEMISEAKRLHIPLLVGYQHNFNPLTKHILGEIKKRGKPNSISLTFHEYLRDMNKFRDMNLHHLAQQGGGGVMLALSHDLDLLLQFTTNENYQLDFSLESSGEFPNVFDKVSITGLVSQDLNNATEVEVSLSYAQVLKERRGRVSWGSSSIDWDFFTGKITISDKESSDSQQIKLLRADELILLQLIFLLNKNALDEDLILRIDRALEIAKWNVVALNQARN